jgi:hypothetical protein
MGMENKEPKGKGAQNGRVIGCGGFVGAIKANLEESSER